MASSKWIKGIVVEISGDTTGLTKALGDVDAETRSLQKELNQVNKLLKFDPKNTELLAQKQMLLTKEIANTSDKYKALVKAKEEMEKKGNFTEEEAKRYRELTREVEATKQELSKLKNEGSGVADAFDDASDSALTLGDIIKANIISEAIVGGVKALANAITGIAKSMVDVVKSGVEYNAQMQQYQTSFTAMLGDSEKANAMIENIKKNASQSPFDVASLVEANQYLLTTGETAENTEKYIQALGDAVAYTGGGNAELKRMAQNLAQIKNVGKASSVDIKQFANAGINIYGILADYMGKSVDQIKEMSISYDDVTKALEKASSEGGLYYGAMSRQTETLNGQLNMLQSNWNEFTGALATDTTNAITNTFLPALNNMVVAMTEGFQTGGINGMVDAFFTGVNDMVGYLTNEENIEAFFDGAIDLVNSVCDGILSYGAGGENAEVTEQAVAKFVEKALEWIDTFIDRFFEAGLKLATSVISGFRQGIDSWLSSQPLANIDVGSMYSSMPRYNAGGSRGFGDINAHMQSGGYGFMSGGVTLNANFTINNANNIDQRMVEGWASTMANLINEELGGRM